MTADGDTVKKMRQHYVWQQTESSFCAECDKHVTLLCEEWGKGPRFYICWDCKLIWHIGYGRVRPGDQ